MKLITDDCRRALRACNKIGVAGLAHSLPPTANAFDGEGRRIMADADTHPAFIGRDVIDPIRRHLALTLDDKIMNPYLLGIALGP